MNKIVYNILISPLVLFIRVPIVITINILVKIGEYADSFGHKINRYLIGFRK